MSLKGRRKLLKHFFMYSQDHLIVTQDFFCNVFYSMSPMNPSLFGTVLHLFIGLIEHNTLQKNSSDCYNRITASTYSQLCESQSSTLSISPFYNFMMFISTTLEHIFILHIKGHYNTGNVYLMTQLSTHAADLLKPLDWYQYTRQASQHKEFCVQTSIKLFLMFAMQPKMNQGRGPQVPECGCYSLSVFHMIFRFT